MTTNHHTSVALNAALNAATFNNPDSEIDSALTDTLDATQEFSQLLAGSGSVDPSAIMELDSVTDGFLPPRMTTTQRDNISSPADGLLIYNTTTSQPEFYNGSSWLVIGSSDAPTISGARAFGATQNVNNNTITDVELPTGERFDTDDYHDLITNDYRLTIPTGKTGIYLISGTVEFAVPASNMPQCYLSIRVSGSSNRLIAQQGNHVVTGTLYAVRLTATTLYEITTVGDFIYMDVLQNSGAAINLTGATKYSPELTAVLLA